MRIYFTGCHGSGKSTLTRYVSKKYNLPIISEVARMVLSEKELQIDTLRHDMDIVDDYQSQIFYRQLQEEAKYKEFVADRSILDCLTYSAQHSRVFPTLLKSKELAQHLPALKAPESILFFVRPSHATLKADGVREAINWDGVIAIDAQIKLLYEMFELQYFQINTDNMQERIKIIDSVLNLYVTK